MYKIIRTDIIDVILLYISVQTVLPAKGEKYVDYE